MTRLLTAAALLAAASMAAPSSAAVLFSDDFEDDTIGQNPAIGGSNVGNYDSISEPTGTLIDVVASGGGQALRLDDNSSSSIQVRVNKAGGNSFGNTAVLTVSADITESGTNAASNDWLMIQIGASAGRNVLQRFDDGDVFNGVAANGVYTVGQTFHVDIVANDSGSTLVVDGNAIPDQDYGLFIDGQFIGAADIGGSGAFAWQNARLRTDSNGSAADFVIDNFEVRDEVFVVPEPASLGLAAVGVGLLLFRRR